MRAEWKDLEQAALARGWRIKDLRKHRVMLLGPDGVAKVTIPSSPSDHRAFANAVAQMRRFGFVWPWPRKEGHPPRCG